MTPLQKAAADAMSAMFPQALVRVMPDGSLRAVDRAGRNAYRDPGAQQILDTWEPSQSDRLMSAAQSAGVSPTQAALAAVVVARVDGTAPPSWALSALRRLVADINQELGQ